MAKSSVTLARLEWSIEFHSMRLVTTCSCGCRTAVTTNYYEGPLSRAIVDAADMARKIHDEYYAQTQRSDEVPVLR